MAESFEVTRAVVPTELPNAARVVAHAAPDAVSTEHEVPEVPEAGAAPPHVVARAEAGERWISRLLRGGAMCSGGLFLASLALEALPASENVHVAIDVLRKGAASALLVTPVVRLVVAGTTLGIRGEWKYALYAAGVLGLLAVAVGAGLHA